jgi:hypothetical protein
MMIFKLVYILILVIVIIIQVGKIVHKISNAKLLNFKIFQRSERKSLIIAYYLCAICLLLLLVIRTISDNQIVFINS